MKLNDLTEKNKKFQDAVAQITELVHHMSVLEYCTQLIRSGRKLDSYLRKLLSANSEMQFTVALETLEEESDEILFILDRLTDFDRKNNTEIMGQVVKKGFDLVSIYSYACDKLIASRLSKDEFDS